MEVCLLSAEIPTHSVDIVLIYQHIYRDTDNTPTMIRTTQRRLNRRRNIENKKNKSKKTNIGLTYITTKSKLVKPR